jgi:CBS domain-containing membrane protein
MKPRHMTVADFMVTAIVTVRADETLGAAHADMEMGAFRHLPVVDARRRLVGILSDRDLLRALGRAKSTTIAEIMTLNPVTVRPETAAHVATALMLDRKIGSLPVVAEDGALVGLVTETDFLDVARRALLALPLTP